jgi:hypothetical protein
MLALTKRVIGFGMACLVALCAPALFAQGQLIDRVVGVVDGHVITLDQWQQQERFEAVMQDKNPADIRLTQASLNRIIDNLLVVSNRNTIPFAPVTPEEVNQQLANVRKQLSDAGTVEAWRRKLASYGLTEDEVKAQLADQLNTLRFIDARFRPGARVTPEQISAYYRDKFVPQFQKEAPNSTPPPLASVTDRITSILTEQLMDQRFGNWVQNLRAQAKVQILLPPQNNPPASTSTQVPSQ